ncbi:hypothetical protein HMPREF9444_00996 [Succinatimonas hippei YIT 12066]|uniref:Uncharacterized protein n=1 Tax=Succinatimonas hippei (strain DSM 22608 / JCM 16073 / KCTC 15190 / YIT 12066) TaxID=762983 RepID=E8LJW0_SUCHY|nr:hypothetical protein HMPREF9444_00996 [Succinatimonas hippei YIT 12066]
MRLISEYSAHQLKKTVLFSEIKILKHSADILKPFLQGNR